MKILFYVDPWVDISDKPEFKLLWLKGFLNKTVRNLYQYASAANQKLDLKLLYSDILDVNLVKDELGFLSFSAISQKEIKDIFNNFGEYLSLQRASQNNGKFDLLNNLISSKLDGFNPDVIILMSSTGTYLKFAFPNSLILFTETGIFAQKPYPGCLYFDASCAMNESFILKNKDQILSFSAGPDGKKFLFKLRSFFQEKLKKQNPYLGEIKNLRKKFKHLILFSLQRFDSPLFRTTADFKDQLEYIEYVFDNLDSDIGVIITEHRKDRILHFAPIIDYLKRKYLNLIYLKKTNELDNSSQFLLELTDGVITVSSTVGLQAMIHQKPLFVPSKFSYLAAFCDEDNLKNVGNFLKNKKYQSKDNALYYLITHYYILGTYYQDGKWFYNFLSDLLDNFNQKKNFPFYKRIASDEALIKNLIYKKKTFCGRIINSINKRLRNDK